MPSPAAPRAASHCCSRRLPLPLSPPLTRSSAPFTGILNANALYSFTIGFPQLGCSIAYILYFAVDPILLLSLAVGSISLVLSVALSAFGLL